MPHEVFRCGHPKTPENTRRKACRICERAASRRRYRERYGHVTPERHAANVAARAEGVRKMIADPRRGPEWLKKTSEGQQKRYTKEERARYSEIMRQMRPLGWITHNAATRRKISEAVRARYDEARAKWVDGGGKSELVGDIKCARIDWELVSEFKAEGMTDNDIAEFFATAPAEIRRGPRHVTQD